LTGSQTNPYVGFLQESFGDLYFALKDLHALLTTASSRLVQWIRLQVTAHHWYLDALGDQRLGSVSLPFQKYFLEIVGFRFRRLY